MLSCILAIRPFALATAEVATTLGDRPDEGALLAPISKALELGLP